MRRKRLALPIAIAAILVVVIVVLVAFRGAIFPASSPAQSGVTATVPGLELKIVQGTTSGGIPWFGPSPVNYSASGDFPAAVASGGTFTVGWTFSNYDDVPHTIFSITVNSPYTFVATNPGLPYNAPSEGRSLHLEITFQVPAVSSDETLGWALAVADAEPS